MKNKKIVIASIVLLFLAFIAAVSMYQKSEDKKLEVLITKNDKNNPLIKDHSPKFGKNKKNVVIVEFLDPQCPSCKAFHPALEKVFKEYDEEVLLVIRYLDNHSSSKFIVQILEASRKQNKFKETLNVLFKSQNIWGGHQSAKPEMVWNFLKDVKGLDIKKLKKYIASNDISDILKIDRQDALKLGVTGTPEFFVNGKKLKRLSYQSLLDLVESEIYR